MLHIVLATYIVSFSLGLGLIFLSLISYDRFGNVGFSQFALAFGALTLLLVVEAFKTYERAAIGVFGSALPFMCFFMTVAGNGVLARAFPILAFQIVSIPIPRQRKIAHFFAVILVSVFGGLKVLAPSELMSILDSAGVMGIYIYGTVFLIRNYERIEHPHVRSLVRGFFIIVASTVITMGVQLMLQNTPPSSGLFLEYPFAQILFYLSVTVLLLVYAMRYLFKPVATGFCSLPDEFVKKYGISPRECEIVSMIVQGYTNRMIGEKLFISAMTVKNHVYHIYQKTGVENKIQLLNLINSPK